MLFSNIYVNTCVQTFKEFEEKLTFLKTAAQTFEAEYFLNIFLRFWVF